MAKGRVVFDPELVAVMRAHGYTAEGKTRAEVHDDATAFLRDKIESLGARPGASTREQMPHAVLTRCWLRAGRPAMRRHDSMSALGR
jgi:hypothetical protein